MKNVTDTVSLPRSRDTVHSCNLACTVDEMYLYHKVVVFNIYYDRKSYKEVHVAWENLGQVSLISPYKVSFSKADTS